MTEPLIARIEKYLNDERIGWGITTDLLREALAALKEKEALNSELISACKMAHGSLDKLMGDSDLNNDNSPEMEACQTLASIIVKCSDGKIVPKDANRLAWLIENGKAQGHGLKYQTFDPDSGMFTWTVDVYKALHFSRRKDAELIARESEDAWRIVEHSFAPAIERTET